MMWKGRYKIMEVKINREIRNYTESIYFGLTLRQFICSLCACIVAVGLYFICSPFLNKEIVSWICILGAIPFAGLGFFKYNGMNLENFIKSWLKSEILVPKDLKYKVENIYYEMTKDIIENKQREEFNRNDKVN
jgi:hypothetical protein